MYLGDFISRWGLNRIMFSQTRFRLQYSYCRKNKKEWKTNKFWMCGDLIKSIKSWNSQNWAMAHACRFYPNGMITNESIISIVYKTIVLVAMTKLSKGEEGENIETVLFQCLRWRWKSVPGGFYFSMDKCSNHIPFSTNHTLMLWLGDEYKGIQKQLILNVWEFIKTYKKYKKSKPLCLPRSKVWSERNQYKWINYFKCI